MLVDKPNGFALIRPERADGISGTFRAAVIIWYATSCRRRASGDEASRRPTSSSHIPHPGPSWVEVSWANLDETYSAERHFLRDKGPEERQEEKFQSCARNCAFVLHREKGENGNVRCTASSFEEECWSKVRQRHSSSEQMRDRYSPSKGHKSKYPTFFEESEFKFEYFILRTRFFSLPLFANILHDLIAWWFNFKIDKMSSKIFAFTPLLIMIFIWSIQFNKY